MSVQSRINLSYRWIPAAVLLTLIAIAFAGVAFWWPQKLPPCTQKVIFAPQPDITPYELAQLQTKVASLALQICVAANNPIPAEIARHFRAVPQ